MPRYLLLPIALMLSIFAHADDAPPATSPHDLAYSLGASLGERLRQEVPDLQLQALIEGLQQSYEQKPLALSAERMKQILSDHDAAASAQTEQAEESKVDTAMAAEQRFMAEERAKPDVKELSQGILFNVLTAGTGEKPAATGKVQVRYTGRLPDGSVFDENQQAQWFSLGSVITGWRVALQQMPVGSKWRVVIPSQLAYGADGAGELIAPYTPLVFDIELLGTAD